MILQETKWKGGARIGRRNANVPFAQLTLTAEKLVLRVTFLGTYSFNPDQVKKVESYGLIPYIGKGVRIHHCVPNYPEKIIFWYLCLNPQHIVDAISELGYGT